MLLNKTIDMQDLDYESEYQKAFEDYNIEALEHVFLFWRQSLPKISTIVANLSKPYPFPRAIRKAIAATSLLADQPNKNPFHNNHHFLEVFALAFFLGKYAYENEILSLDNFGILLVSSLIHDYKHDGKGNKVDDQHEPYRLERNSYDQAEPVLIEAGLQKPELDFILQIVLATDTSAENGQSPSSNLKQYSLAPEDTPLIPALNLFEDDQKREVALMMLDADVGQSAAMSFEGNNERGKLIAQEIGVEHSDQFMIDFLERVCEKQFFSKAGKELMQYRIEAIIKQYGI